MTTILHTMGDLETWGVEPGCDLRSIGFVMFNPATGQFGDEFYVAVDGGEAYGLVREPKTVEFWDDQPEEAKAKFANPVDLKEGLQRLSDWLAERNPEHHSDPVLYTRFWCMGPQFDEAILAAAYRAVGLPVPWYYRAARDVRTIIEAVGLDPKNDIPNFGTEHYAIDDAKAQILGVRDAYGKLLSNAVFGKIEREIIRDLIGNYATEIKELRDRRDDLLKSNNLELELRRAAFRLLREAAGMFRMYERHHRAKDGPARREKAERNAAMAEKIEALLDGRLTPGVDLVELVAVGRDLYFAGRWTCDADVDAAGLWSRFRDALGLPEGTATALGIGQTTPSRYERLEAAARNLREAQKAYMADRGNENLGKAVGEAAAELDLILGDA